MQYLSIFVVFIVFICSLKDFKNTVLIWMVVRTLFNAQVAVRYASPAMSCVIAVDFVLVSIYFFRYYGRETFEFSKDKFYFEVPMLAMLSSYIISSLFAYVTPVSGLTATIKYFVSNFAMLYLFQKCLKEDSDILIFLKATFIVVLLQTGLALSEQILKDNIWLDFVFFNSPHDDTTHGRMFYTPPQLGGTLEMRYGMVRCRSFFGIHIAFGFFCLMYLYLLMSIYVKKIKLYNKSFLLIVIGLLFAGVMMGNSKTSYIGMIILMFSVFRLSHILSLRLIGPFLLLIIGVVTFFPEYTNNIYSLFDEDLAEEGGGSTVVGREIQFKTAMKMFDLSPIVGNGPGSIGLLKNRGYGDILGAESSWMQILPERGIYGAVMYIIMYVSVYSTFGKLIGKRRIFFFLLSLFVMETATGVLSMSIWATVLVVLSKLYSQKIIYEKR